MPGLPGRTADHLKIQGVDSGSRIIGPDGKRQVDITAGADIFGAAHRQGHTPGEFAAGLIRSFIGQPHIGQGSALAGGDLDINALLVVAGNVQIDGGR